MFADSKSDGDGNVPEEGDRNALNSHRLLVQGIQVPLDAPLFPLWSLLAHPDLFLYVVLLDPIVDRNSDYSEINKPCVEIEENKHLT